MDDRVQSVLGQVRAAWEPTEPKTVSEWADAYRRLSAEASAEPGQWRTARAPYQRGMMDALAEPGIETVVIISSAQIGKTEVLGNAVGYYIDHDPSPILLIQPTLELSEAWSKDRLAPMLRDSPKLQGRVRDATSRNSGNTLLHKTFEGGHITMGGANSAAGLAMRPIRILLCDEVDRYPASAGTEGDPVSLASKRQNNFWNRKTLLTSTPTIAGSSRIETAWNGSDRRRFHVPCPHCDTYQTLAWPRVTWPKGEPWAATCACLGCGTALTDADKPRMLARGEWRAEAPGGRVAGFHLNELYSPWRTFGQIAEAFLEAKRSGPESLRVWINTSLGEVWNPRDQEMLQPDGLMKRRETYEAPVPAGVAVLTAGCDVQGDRLEWMVVGWGIGGESWVIDFGAIFGNLALRDPWDQLGTVLASTWRHASGEQMRPVVSFVDHGGHYPSQVTEFCQRMRLSNVFPCKGASTIQARPVQRGTKKGRIWMIDTIAMKDQLFARLRVETPGPGYIHFPMKADKLWFEQLLSEVVIRKRTAGIDRRVYDKITPTARNEALDLMVYASAAFAVANPRDLRPPGAVAPEAPPAPVPAPEPAFQPLQPLEPMRATPRMPRPRGGGGWARGGGTW